MCSAKSRRISFHPCFLIHNHGFGKCSVASYQAKNRCLSPMHTLQLGETRCHQVKTVRGIYRQRFAIFSD
jgi:hypothetical protein